MVKSFFAFRFFMWAWTSSQCLSQTHMGPMVISSASKPPKEENPAQSKHTTASCFLGKKRLISIIAFLYGES